LKNYFPQSRFIGFNETQVAVLETAIGEFDPGEVGARKIATDKGTIVVLTLGERGDFTIEVLKGFIFGKNIIHRIPAIIESLKI
jgi:hypothetical protein